MPPDISDTQYKKISGSKSERKRNDDIASSQDKDIKNNNDTLRIGDNVSPIDKAQLVNDALDNESISEVNNLEYLLNLNESDPEYSKKIHSSNNCKSGICNKILDSFPTLRSMKISYLADMGHNIKHSDLERLCQSCQKHFYEMYKEKIGTCANEGPEVFLAEVLESNTNEEYKGALEYLSNLIDDPKADQRDIDSFLYHYQDLRVRWNAANRIFKELLNEAAARHMGYDIDAGLQKKAFKGGFRV